jgi:hypothetical protein
MNQEAIKAWWFDQISNLVGRNADLVAELHKMQVAEAQAQQAQRGNGYWKGPGPAPDVVNQDEAGG